jgi:hypothetical protein
MKLLQISPGRLILGITLIVLGIVGSYFLYGMIFPPNNLPQTGVSPATTQEDGGAYCFIQEVQSDFIRNSVSVHLTDDDLEDFPSIGKFIRNPGNFSKTWHNGRRTVGDFTDYQHQYSDFWNLSCRNISYEECHARQVPVVFEYDGRYHEVSCLPDFGGAHRTRDT